ncbi:MAG TPA: 3-hydroxyacyl-CoA dehydrogenase [Trebonia sp.]|jgi:3-hydroxybutyryl-CoA dehydrogenase|nr:3-hydroxyacyl-CoA dehydrogenase [Trebonia sp.]
MTTPAPVGVIGAGTMGAGIAQVAAVAGRRVLLLDAADGAAARSVERVREQVKTLVAKGYLQADPDAVDITAVASAADLAGCGLVIEAIVEDLSVKKSVFASLEDVVAADCVLASNSSSLSPTAMAAGLRHPERLVGLHFFNPVPRMELVEVISGLATAPAVAGQAAELARAWGKTVVFSSATPAFIVNRVARPFYAEAWRVHAERAASYEVIDAVLTGAGGFRMGPFELMDLIGHDVNEAVTRSVWSSFGHDPRFAPALGQRALVEAGWLGRKSGRGCYEYEAGKARKAPLAAPAGVAVPEVTEYAPPALGALLGRAGVRVRPGDPGEDLGLLDGTVELPSGAVLDRSNGATASSVAFALDRPVIMVDRTLDDATATAIAIAPSDGCPPAAVAEAVGLLQAAGLAVHVIGDVPGLIVTRTVAMLANLAADAIEAGVATADDVDVAMRLGVNYPRGPVAWGRQWGARTILTILDSLENWYRDGHYRAAPALRHAVLAGGGPPAGLGTLPPPRAPMA